MKLKHSTDRFTHKLNNDHLEHQGEDGICDGPVICRNYRHSSKVTGPAFSERKLWENV